ncbi:MAG: hypothetical protein RLN99_16735, partial [Kiloniellaceae bacterium]
LLWHAFIAEKHDISREDVEMVVDDMRLDAAGLSVDGEPPAEVQLDVEPEGDDAGESQADISADRDRVIDFRSGSHDKDG